MAAPLVDPALNRLKQATTTVARASEVLRAALPAHPCSITSTSSNTIAVPQPRGKLPVHLLPNSAPQPWELLPLKAAAFREYPNFFNASCAFFGSLDRDVRNALPFTLLRPNRLALDLSRIVTNLGIVAALELVQRRGKLRPGSPRLPDAPRLTARSASGLEVDALALRQYAHAYIRLHLRHNAFRPIWDVADQQDALAQRARQELAAQPSGRASDSFQAQRLLSQRVDSQHQASTSGSVRPACTHTHASLPLSATNISRASRPVMMYPRQMVDRLQVLPPGLLFLYHHQLGVITDAQAEHYDVPGLVMAHVGLPASMVTQIRGALRDKAAREAGLPLTQVTRLQDWSMADALQRCLDERAAALGRAGAEGGGSLVGPQLEAIERSVAEAGSAARRRLAEHDVSARLQEELLAWELERSGALGVVPPAFLAPRPGGASGDGGGGARAGGAGDRHGSGGGGAAQQREPQGGRGRPPRR